MSFAIRQGMSQAASAAEAVAELAIQLTQPDIGVIWFFCSSHYDRDQIAAAMRKAFGSTLVIGCTTSGEITPQGYKSGTITGVSLGRSIARADAILIRNLGTFGLNNLLDAVRALNHRMELVAGASYASKTFATLFIDGMSGAEDGVLSALQTIIPDIPLFGGSAGDDLAFKESFVFAEGEFHSNSAVLAMVNSSLPFKVFKTQHFVASDRKMVITGADPVKRIVTEINAEPAAQEFARRRGAACEAPRGHLVAQVVTRSSVARGGYTLCLAALAARAGRQVVRCASTVTANINTQRRSLVPVV